MFHTAFHHPAPVTLVFTVFPHLDFLYFVFSTLHPFFFCLRSQPALQSSDLNKDATFSDAFVGYPGWSSIPLSAQLLTKLTLISHHNETYSLVYICIHVAEFIHLILLIHVCSWTHGVCIFVEIIGKWLGSAVKKKKRLRDREE